MIRIIAEEPVSDGTDAFDGAVERLAASEDSERAASEEMTVSGALIRLT